MDIVENWTEGKRSNSMPGPRAGWKCTIALVNIRFLESDRMRKYAMLEFMLAIQQSHKTFYSTW